MLLHPHISQRPGNIKISISRSFRVFFHSRNQIGKIINCNSCSRSLSFPAKKLKFLRRVKKRGEKRVKGIERKQARGKRVFGSVVIYGQFFSSFFYFYSVSLHDVHTHSSGDCFYVQSCGFAAGRLDSAKGFATRRGFVFWHHLRLYAEATLIILDEASTRYDGELVSRTRFFLLFLINSRTQFFHKINFPPSPCVPMNSNLFHLDHAEHKVSFS
jgi:hypothetical protein